ANTAEYAPFLAIMFLWHGVHDAPTWILWTIVIATLSRYLLAGALLFAPTMAKPNFARFVGALGTYMCGLLLAAAMLRRALSMA
ncbi:MAG TPA: MAPEG family protein, partial [Xanthobacteraceae bacterium]|nr:MAPEG family protein [Xanthobacteraceae bacterium]